MDHISLHAQLVEAQGKLQVYAEAEQKACVRDLSVETCVVLPLVPDLIQIIAAPRPPTIISCLLLVSLNGMQKELARQKREDAGDQKNAIQTFVELLASQPEDTWTSHLLGMGQGADVPRIFRCAGKVPSLDYITEEISYEYYGKCSVNDRAQCSRRFVTGT